jgi:hypothetical protein
MHLGFLAENLEEWRSALASSYQDFHPMSLPKITAPKIDFTECDVKIT